jgi:hypothetical protein
LSTRDLGTHHLHAPVDQHDLIGRMSIGVDLIMHPSSSALRCQRQSRSSRQGAAEISRRRHPRDPEPRGLEVALGGFEQPGRRGADAAARARCASFRGLVKLLSQRPYRILWSSQKAEARGLFQFGITTRQSGFRHPARIRHPFDRSLGFHSPPSAGKRSARVGPNQLRFVMACCYVCDSRRLDRCTPTCGRSAAFLPTNPINLLMSTIARISKQTASTGCYAIAAGADETAAVDEFLARTPEVRFKTFAWPTSQTAV